MSTRYQDFNDVVRMSPRLPAAPSIAAPSVPWPARTALRPALRTSAKIEFHCAFHVVWCTQYRSPVLEAEIAERLKKVIAEVISEKDAWLVEIDVNPVHVHLVLEVSPQFGIHRLVKAIKARSAQVLRTEFPSLRSRLPSLWTNAYLVMTTGHGAPSSMIEQYVAQQRTR